MRVETNDKLVGRNRKIAQYLFFFSFGILILGLFLTNRQAFGAANTDELILGGVLSAVVIVVAFVSTIASVRMTNLWVREPRPEALLREGLKGLSNKAVLYNYYYFPARHVLISPQGVFAITTRWQDGRFTNEGDQWTSRKSLPNRLFSLLRFDSIGNPTHDAIRSAQHVQKLLAPIAPDVPVQPIIIFTSPRAEVTLVNPTVPVLRAQDKMTPNLRDYLRGIDKEARVSLTPQQIEAFEKATLPARS